MNSRLPRAIAGGIAGTLVMSLVGLYAAPMMGIPPMNPASMLAAQMGGIAILGWAGHLMIGTVLALVFAMAAAPRLPGPPVARGALFSLAPWLMAQVVVMPMMGMGLFSSSPEMATGSLIGHLVYGAVLGAVAGAPVVAGFRGGEAPLASSS